MDKENRSTLQFHEEEQDYNGYSEMSEVRPKGIPLTYAFNILAVILIVGLLGLMILQNERAELEVKEAYTLSVFISLAENNLLLKYGAFPEDVGLGQIQDAWINNPCVETATKYADALKAVLEYLDLDSDPGYIDNEFEQFVIYQV